MKSLLAFLLAPQLALSEARPLDFTRGEQGRVEGDVCHVELVGLEVSNAELQQALVVQGVALNRSPLELDSLTLEFSLYADNGVKFRTLHKVIWSKVLPRRGMTISIKDAPLGTIRLGSYRVKVSYRIEGTTDLAFEFENGRLKSGKFYEDTEGGTRLGLAGIRTIMGSYQKQGKNQVYTGDVVCLRLRGEGLDDKARPEGTLEVALSLDGKKQGAIRREIHANHWKPDRPPPTNDADPRMIAYDPAAKELVIALVRVEDEKKAAKLGLEAKFTWKGQVWTWTGLPAPFIEAPRPPDKK